MTIAAMIASTWATLQARRTPPPERQRPPQRSAAEIIAEGRAALALAEAPVAGMERERLITLALRDTRMTAEQIEAALKLPATQARVAILKETTKCR